MSEIIVAPGTTTPQLGLVVTSTEAIRLEQTTPDAPVVVTGSAASDTVVAVSITDTTAFTINGELGNDILSGAAGSDTISGGDGEDQIVGDLGNDTITGGAGADDLDGGAGRDQINGGAGADIIAPGPGRDTITTGPGNDVIRFEARSLNGGVDRITDFTPQDTIEISRQLLRGSGLQPGRLSTSDFRAVRSIRDLDDEEAAKIIYERRTGYVYYNRDNGRDVRLFQLDRNLNISAADFEIF
ncbi:MAG: calcium-binding protein [Microcoleus sp. SIO2G3]|nr:calcium-binding protein [Microcoleus sp. SIO2G3]